MFNFYILLPRCSFEKHRSKSLKNEILRNSPFTNSTDPCSGLVKNSLNLCFSKEHLLND